MRNILIPLIILIAVLTFVVCNLFFVTNSSKKLDAILVSATEYAKNGDFEASVKEIEAFCRELEAIEGYLYAVVTHDEVDDIIFSSNRLIALCNEETKEQFFAELEVARQSLSLMHDAEIPYLENIL